MRILVTGGAGYIGSHTVRLLVASGHEVSVLDDLSTGHRAALPNSVRLFDVELCTGDVGRVLEATRAEAVIHFAGKALVPESVRDPGTYYRVNALGGLRLLEAMRERGVHRIVFSSTCATYGLPHTETIGEDLPQRPVTAYGASKLVFEHMLRDFATAHGLGAIALRYFNAAGAAADAQHGEDHAIETHAIPLLLIAARDGGPFRIFGTDYETPDGSCVRDYIHIDDLAEAHRLAVLAVTPGRFEAMNLGTGVGSSVREVVATARSITGRTITVIESPRRPGDPPRLVADVRCAAERLGFRARHDLRSIITTAWRWHCDRPRGYA